MNRIYRLVFNRALGQVQVASEVATRGRPGPGRSRAKRRLHPGTLRASLALALLLTSGAYVQAATLPTGASIQNGTITIVTNTTDSSMAINQASNKALINWSDFSIGSGGSVTFNQPSAAAVALNVVTGNASSVINGGLAANGQVFLVNPNGVLFTPTAQVNVGGLVASTLALSTEDFLAGHYTFEGASSNAVINQGSISAAPGGAIALIAAKVTNTGSLAADGGSVLLGAGSRVTLDLGGPVKIEVAQGAIDALIEQGGAIRADGGTIYLTAKAAGDLATTVINHTGITQARTLATGEQGQILLLGDMDNGRIEVAGTLDASAPDGGNGGFIETSAARVGIADGVQVTTLAAQGTTGTWLIDPTDFTVHAGEGAQTTGGIGAETLSDNLQRTSVLLQTVAGGSEAGDINVDAAVTWSADTALTLDAHGDININAAITATGENAGLALNYGGSAGDSSAAPASGSDYHVNAPVTLSGSDASLSINGNAYTLIHSMEALDAIDSTGLSGRYALAQDLDASGTTYTSALVGTGSGASSFTGTFAGLGHTVSNLAISSNGSYVGLFGSARSGSTIRDLGLVDVEVSGNSYVGGLVGGSSSSSISNAYATGSVSGSGNQVGGLVGDSDSGSISNAYATGSVIGNDNVGGLVGYSSSSISDAYATGSVSGSGNQVGGLVGYSSSSISNAYATGSVSGNGNGNVGGLVGYSSSSISNAYATGSVSGNGNVGGLVGSSSISSSSISISNAYATGSVSGNRNVGGLVGSGIGSGNLSISIRDAYATGSVSGGDYVGGLVGSGIGSGNPSISIRDAYATGSVSGGDYVGGLVGSISISSSISNAYATGSVIGNGNVGGLVGSISSISSSSISNAYATGSVSGSDYVGGLVGSISSISSSSSISNAYATGSVSGSDYVGGLVGYNARGKVIASFFATTDAAGDAINRDLPTAVNANGGTTDGLSGGKTYAELTDLSTFTKAGWNIDDAGGTGLTWRIYDGDTTPLLRSFLTQVTVTASDVTDKTYDGSAASGTSSYTTDLTGASLDGSLSYATDSKNAGTYNTANGGLTLDGLYSGQQGYDISYADASLTIDKAALTVTANDAGKTYDGLAWSGGNDVNYSGFVNGENQSVLGGSLAYGGDAQGATNAGRYALTASGLSSGNYAISYEAGTLTIGQASLIISTSDVSKVYDGTTSASGTAIATAGTQLFGNDSLAGGTFAFTDKNAGENKTVTVSGVTIDDGNGGANYTVSYADNTASDISKLAISGTITADNKTYDGTTAATTSGSLAEVIAGDDLSVASTGTFEDKNAATGKTVNVAGTVAGDDAGNYDVSFNTIATANIDKRSIAITAGDASKTYGETDPSLGWEISSGSLVAGDHVTHVDLASTGSAATANVGRYTITTDNADGTGLSNYAITYLDGTLTVGQAGLTITANDAAKTYGQTASLTGYTVDGLLNGDSVGSVDLASTGSAATTNVGDYTITANNADGAGLSNYDITYADGTLSIGKAGLTITASDASKTYGQTAGLTGYTASGLVNGDTVGAVDLTSNGSASTANVGNYTITAANADGTGLANYDITYADGTLTINKAGLTITASDASKIYGQTATLTGYTATGLVNGDTVGAVDLTSTGSASTANVGNYTITAANADGTGLANYDIAYANGTLSIGKAGLTITASDASKIYGQTTGLTSYTTSGLVNGDTVDSVDLSSAGAASTATVGGYTITASGATGGALSNYDISYANGTLTVGKAGLTITARDAGKTYGETGGLAGYEVAGLVNGDAVSSVNLASAGTAATATVGDYVITASGAAGDALSNYDISYANGTLTVGKAGLTITASDVGKTYGETATLGYAASGLVNGDTVDSVDLASAGSTATASVGGYTITAANAEGTGLSNYDISYADGTLTVGKAGLTITASDASKTYGQTAGLTGYTAAGLVNDDAVSSVDLASAGSAATATVGNYTITAANADGTGLSNYDIAYVDGTLTINKAGLTITASDASKTYGQTAGLTGYTTAGLVNDDAVSSVDLASAGSAATATVGNYTITANNADGAGLSNYDIAYVDGTLSIGKAGLTITASDASKTYGQTTTLTDFTTAGLVNGDVVSQVQLDSEGTGISAATGQYAINVGGAQGQGLDNYAVQYAPGVLTVNGSNPALMGLVSSSVNAISPKGSPDNGEFAIANPTAPAQIVGDGLHLPVHCVPTQSFSCLTQLAP